MEVKQLSIVVDLETLNSLKELLYEKRSDEERKILASKVLPFWGLLNTKYELGNAFEEVANEDYNGYSPEQKIEYLKKVNERQKWQITSLMWENMLSKQLASFAGQNLAGVVADISIIPEPVIVHCTKEDKGYDYSLNIRDILAIESDGRIKRIYLRKTMKSGHKESFVETNSNFKELLWHLQKSNIHLQRVNKSYAINIFEYSFVSPDTFQIIDKPFTESPAHKTYDSIMSIKADSSFEEREYFKRLQEIDYHLNYRNNMGLNQQKMEEITRYINSLHVTN